MTEGQHLLPLIWTLIHQTSPVGINLILTDICSQKKVVIKDHGFKQ